MNTGHWLKSACMLFCLSIGWPETESSLALSSNSLAGM